MSNDSSNISKTTTKPDTVRTWPWHPAIAVVFGLGWFVICQIVAGLVAVIVLSALRNIGLSVDNAVRQFTYFALAEGLTLVGLYWFLRKKQFNFRSLGLKGWRWSDPLRAIVAFAVYFAIYAIILSITAALVPSLNLNQRQDLGFETHQNLLGMTMAFLSLVVLAPITEEVLFRGLVLQSLRSRLRFVWAAIFTSLVFGAAHLTGGGTGAALLWTAGIDTFILSMTLCYLREKTGRLWPGICLHALKNCIAFVSLFILHH